MEDAIVAEIIGMTITAVAWDEEGDALCLIGDQGQRFYIASSEGDLLFTVDEHTVQ